ncbi:MAG: serine hydrolase domain-containing protein [Clostridia bacterium]
MPLGTLKNTLYGLALPVMGMRCEWKGAAGGEKRIRKRLCTLLHKRHAVGACIQCFHEGELTDCYTAGYAAKEPDGQPVTPNTYFRAASIAKMVTALLVLRLQTQGKLSIYDNVSDLLGFPVQNPYYPEAPITLGMLLGHTSSLVDSPHYFASFKEPCNVSQLLREKESYARSIPGIDFRYSNFAAGFIGCLLEKRFGYSFEALAQRELFAPLDVKATFDLSTVSAAQLSNGYRVLPAECCFDAQSRLESAVPLSEPNPEKHYLLASGGLYCTASALATLALVACNGNGGFINPESLAQMQKPVTQWPQERVRMLHGMGLLQVDDRRISPQTLWGHQGFAYGAVNGVFFDQAGTGFAALNSGASEQRVGHLAKINQDLISLFLK